MDHNAALCKCLDDDEIVRQIRTQGVHDAIPLDATRCDCLCRKCCERKRSYNGYIDRARMERRLEKAGFAVDIFADLLWLRIIDKMEGWMKERVAERVKEALQNMVLKSYVRLSSEHMHEDKNGDHK